MNVLAITFAATAVLAAVLAVALFHFVQALPL